MSGGLKVLALQEDDVKKMLTATAHLGSDKVNFQMEQYVYKRRPDGINIINLGRTWEKILLAARAIAAIEHPQDVYAISSRQFGQRAVLKFANYTKSTPIAGRFTPGAFTNQIQKAFREPRLLIVTDPLTDHQPIIEASYVNIPVIAFCNTDSPLKYIDIAIPCNTKSTHSIGLVWWLLTSEVLRIRGLISRNEPWSVVVDLYFYRDPEETEKEEASAKEALPTKQLEDTIPAHAIEAITEAEADNWADSVPKIPTVAAPEDWNEDDTLVASAPKTATWGGANTGF